MIIGIGGKIGSGKDLVGKIVQVLTAKDKGSSYSHGMLTRDIDILGYIDNTFEIKKYAGKLKDMVCLLLSCTREQLEDSVFKEKKLGKEWLVWCRQDNDPDNYVLTLHSSEGKAHLHSDRTVAYEPNVYNRILTPRKLLQLLGTECGRDIIHPNIWINALMSDYKVIDPENGISMGNIIDYSECKFPNWIITDVRFPNELKDIKDRDGITIKVDRNWIDLQKTNEEFKKIGSTLYNPNFNKDQHTSETALDNNKFDYTINNNGTINELIIKVSKVLIKEKII